MKPLLTFILLMSIAVLRPSSLLADRVFNNAQLQKEIVNLVKNQTLRNMDTDTQEVTVQFLINAQNEVVIFDASGDSDAACAHVKQVLNYKQVKYKDAKPLTPYTINIRFVKDGE